MNFSDQILYYIVDMGIVFLLGVVIGIVIRRAFMYLIALALASSLAVMYFQWRGVLRISFDTIGSTISITTTQYSAMLLAVFIIGIAVGIASAKKRKPRKNET
ncbi:MAG TPA: hypothetical protein ENF25_03115 [Thermoprotei archaeon]|nr:hypothetical protein [Thermoprotei archaeon]